MKNHPHYPSWRYHPTQPAFIVRNAQEDEILSDQWRAHPYRDDEASQTESAVEPTPEAVVKASAPVVDSPPDVKPSKRPARKR